jgi:hypothetical protein
VKLKTPFVLISLLFPLLLSSPLFSFSSSPLSKLSTPPPPLSFFSSPSFSSSSSSPLSKLSTPLPPPVLISSSLPRFSFSPSLYLSTLPPPLSFSSPLSPLEWPKFYEDPGKNTKPFPTIVLDRKLSPCKSTLVKSF